MRADRAIALRARWLAPALLLAALGACAWLVPHLRAPRLAVVGVRVRRADFWQQQLEVRLRVRNPNPVSLPIEALNYTLTLNGQHIANGRAAQGFTVPAHGTAEFNTEVTANMAGALLGILGDGRHRLVHYRLRGKVELPYGLLRELPFDERGQFRLR